MTSNHTSYTTTRPNTPSPQRKKKKKTKLNSLLTIEAENDTAPRIANKINISIVL